MKEWKLDDCAQNKILSFLRHSIITYDEFTFWNCPKCKYVYVYLLKYRQSHIMLSFRNNTNPMCQKRHSTYVPMYQKSTEFFWNCSSSGFPRIRRISWLKMAQMVHFLKFSNPLFGLNYVPMAIAHLPKVYWIFFGSAAQVVFRE